jgi:hypothetical protein
MFINQFGGTQLWAARLKRPLKKSKQQIPRGLKAARDDKNEGLIGTTEVVP